MTLCRIDGWLLKTLCRIDGWLVKTLCWIDGWLVKRLLVSEDIVQDRRMVIKDIVQDRRMVIKDIVQDRWIVSYETMLDRWILGKGLERIMDSWFVKGLYLGLLFVYILSFLYFSGQEDQGTYTINQSITQFINLYISETVTK